MLGRTPGHDLRDPPAEGRRDRRLRRHRADAAPLHPEGAPAPLRASARRRLRPVRRHRRREARRRGGDALRRRAPGLPDRGADGRRDRRRPAGRRADREHDRRHRRRHDRGRGDLARRHRRLAVAARRRRRDGRGDRQPHQEGVQAARSASRRPRRSSSRSAPRCRMREEVQAEVRGRDMLTGLPKTVDPLLRGGPARARRAGHARSSTRSSRRSTRRRPSSPPTSWTAASSSPAAARCCTGLDERLRHETQMPVHLAESPLTCVAVGSGPQPRGVRGDPPQRSASAQRPPQAADRRLGAAGLSRPAADPSPTLRPLSCPATAPHGRRCWALRVRRPATGKPSSHDRPPPSGGGSSSGCLVLALARPRSRSRSASRRAAPLHGVQSAGATVLRPFEVARRPRRAARSATPTAGSTACSTRGPRTSGCRSEIDALRQQVIQNQSRRSENAAAARRCSRTVDGPSLPGGLHRPSPPR